MPIMNQNIPDFFRGQTVLITGGTGFMGKVLVEKLLRSCPEIEKIYLIIRERRNKTISERLHEMCQLPIFEKIKSERPGIVETKLVAIKGNMMEKKLGLSEEDYIFLSQNISIIFHAAASIRFNDSLTFATKMNTRGTKELVDLAYKMKKLVVFLHVSTTYCNCDRKEVGEVIYPAHADWKETLAVVENLDTTMVNILSNKYIGNMPNTYVLTKSLAEHVIWEQRDKLPIVIFRPSIVISALKEPLPGWIDNLNGPVGILIGYSKGVIRTALSDNDIIPDYMAVDLAIRAMIIAVWHRAQISGNTTVSHIYNGSSVQKSIPISEMVKLAIEYTAAHPFHEMLWHFGTHSTKRKWLFTLHVYFKHLLPAIIIDLLLKLSGKKPILMDIQRKYYSAMMALAYFTTNAWTFHNSNFLKLNDALLPEDKEDFDFGFQDVVPEEYFKTASEGARKFILHEPEGYEEAAKRKAKRLRYLDLFLKLLGWILLIWIIISINLPQCVIKKLCEFTEYFYK